MRKTDQKNKNEFQDLFSKFIKSLDDSLFLLEEIKEHNLFDKIDKNNFKVLKELMESSEGLSISILKDIKDME